MRGVRISKHNTVHIVGGLCPLPMIVGDKAQRAALLNNYLTWLIGERGQKRRHFRGDPGEPW